MLADNEINRVLVVTAHPDDADFGAAGTVALFGDRGVEVTYLLVTDGDAGGNERTLDNTGMAELRRAEQTAAAKAVGVTDVRFLGHADGTVVPSLALRKDIARVIRQVRPDLVITHHPDRNYQFIAPSHPDHRAVGGSTLDAVYPDARNPYAFPELVKDEGLEAWTVREVWLMRRLHPQPLDGHHRGDRPQADGAAVACQPGGTRRGLRRLREEPLRRVGRTGRLRRRPLRGGLPNRHNGLTHPPGGQVVRGSAATTAPR